MGCGPSSNRRQCDSKGRNLRPSGSSILVALRAALGLAAALRAQTASPAPSEVTAAQMSAAPNQSSEHTSAAAEGLIKVDVVVTDRSGKPVPSLGPTDLTLLDNGQPGKILSFHAFDGTSATSDLPVEVILVIDTLRMPGMLASHEREEVQKFLGRNGGHLSRPVSVFKLLDSGLWLVAEPSRDGKALAEQIAHDGQLRPIRRAVGPATHFSSSPQPDPPGLLALKALGDIATGERQKPGRKLLVWIGPRREENGTPFEQQRSLCVFSLARGTHRSLQLFRRRERPRSACPPL